MIKLSVNINKIASLRNARGGDIPNLVEAAIKAQEFGADGITVHPRPDQRHIRYQDVWDLEPNIKTEFNIEGKPTKDFIDLVLAIKPAQVTLVPDADDAITSNAGWNTLKHQDFLSDVIKTFKENGIRTSIFLDPDVSLVESAFKTGSHRIELYTEAYAVHFSSDAKKAIKPYLQTAERALEYGLEINAGHDLNLENLAYLSQNLPGLKEVSIGHALISDALYYGLENTIQMYKKRIEKPEKLSKI